MTEISTGAVYKMGDRIKFLLIGDSAVGKSSLIQKYTAGTFGMNGISTIGVEYVKKDIEVDNRTYEVEIWDTAG